MAADVALVLEQLLSPVPGGTGRYARQVAEAVAAERPGARVVGVVAAHRDVAAAQVPGVAGPRRLPVGRRALARAWERGLPPHVGRARLVHAPTVLLPPRRRGQALVVTVHDAVPWTHPETLTPRGVAFHRRCVARAVREADAVVVPTAAVARELAAHVDGWPPRRVEVVGHGVAPALLAAATAPDADARAARLGLPGDGYWLSVATLEPRKGLDVAVAALAEPGAPALPLLVAGPGGWGDLDVRGAARAAGLPDGRVRLLGHLSDDDLAVALSRATALVAPSRSEGFGLPVLEAMALGCPVVVSDAPALVEVAAGAGAVVPRGDAAALAGALARLASDASARRVRAAAGRARAAAFGWDDAARALWALYDHVTVDRA